MPLPVAQVCPLLLNCLENICTDRLNLEKSNKEALEYRLRFIWIAFEFLLGNRSIGVVASVILRSRRRCDDLDAVSSG